MADEVDYSKFSREDLEAEIRREEEALATYRADLAAAEARRKDLEAAISEERIEDLVTRTRLRQERIARLESDLSELESQIRRFDQRITSRAEEIRRVEDVIAREEARLPRISGIERYITAEVIARLRRTLSALHGWQTREAEYGAALLGTRAQNRRILAGLRSWQVRETAFLERVDQLRANLAETITEIERLSRQVATETRRLETKRQYLFTLTITVNNPTWGTTTPTPGTYYHRLGTTATVIAHPAEGYTLDHWLLNNTKIEPHPGNMTSVLMDKNHTLTAVFLQILNQLVDAKIIIYSIVRARPPKKYTKRFQAFYDVDAIRNQATGEIDYSARLTEKEIDACIDYFYALWNWTSLPSNASPPVWIESGEWETIPEPRGADLKQASVREDKEETYNRRFTPPQTVYTPGKAESEEIMKLIKGAKT